MRWLRKLLPSPTPRLDDHVSIWSIAARDARTFFRIAGTLWLVALTYIVYKARDETMTSGAGTGSSEQAWLSIGDTILGVLTDFGAVGIAIAIVSMLLTRAVNTTGEMLMSLYQAMVNRFVIPVIESHKAEGRSEGVKEGLERGLEKGRAETQAEWRGWNARRLTAEHEGREFVEPPPTG